MSWRDVPIPARMAHLPLDRRGYPVPEMIQRAADGTPLFTVNDNEVTRHQLANNLCGICGGHIEVGEYHFAGGPVSAFHPHGSYFDGPMHGECASYAMQVCPYLALPKFLKRADPEEVLKHLSGRELAVDSTMIEGKPECFVVIRAMSFNMLLQRDSGMIYLKPVGQAFADPEIAASRMLDYDVWKDGKIVEDEQEAMGMVRVAIQRAMAQERRRPRILQPGAAD